MSIIEVTKETFESEVLKADGKVLVDFNAAWCGPCRMLKPTLESIAASDPGFKIVSVDIDDQDELADDDVVSSIPGRVVFQGGEEANVAALKAKPNVEFVYNSNVTKLVAEKKLTAVEVTNKLDGSVRTLEVNGLFVAVGRVPENQNFASLVNLDEAGYIPAGEDCRTNAPGIFAAGDNRAKNVRQLVTATADGAVAATEAVKYVNSL